MFPSFLFRFKNSFLLFFAVFIISNLPAQINKQNIEIVRDQWGVPHIYGKTDAETTYGLAWATCEDDFATVQRMLLATKSRMGEVDGKNGALLDFFSFISGATDIVDTLYEKSFSPEYKKIVDAYVEGVNDYAAAYPRELFLKDFFPVTSKDVVAQYILTNMFLANVYIDIQKIFQRNISDYEINVPSGSNAFALDSSRTTDGKTYLAVNSHQPLEGLFSWYEVHLISEEGLNILGGTFPGGMSVFHGTNDKLGWACTINTPDLDDVYKLQMNPKNHLQYWFNDHWETLQVRKKTVKVKLGKIKIPITKTFYWSKYGTTLKNKDGFYSVRFPANMDIRGCEQLYEMNKAKSFTAWRNCMRKVGFPGINFIYADRTDTIFYVSNGQFAYRNPKYDWKKVLPGNTSETLWSSKFHPFDSLPQVLKPQSGYLLNTNNSCFEVTRTCDNPNGICYDPTFGFGNERNNRSIMGHYFFDAQPKFTYEDFKCVKYDCTYNDSFYDHGLQNARIIFDIKPEKYPDIADALVLLKQWNRRSDVNNMQAALVTFSMYPLIDKIIARGTMYEANNFTEKEYVQAIRSAKKHMLKYFGSLAVPLGDVQKHARGNVELPIGGMPEVIAANVTQPYKNGMRRTNVGESYIQLVRYSADTVEIETVNAYGSSAKPGSVHYTDQMKMFAEQKLKPMTMNREKIYNEAESIYHPGEKPARKTVKNVP